MLSSNKKEGTDPRHALVRVRLLRMHEQVQEQRNAPVEHAQPEMPLSSEVPVPATLPSQATWRLVLRSPLVQGIVGIVIGSGLVIAVAHFVDVPTTLRIIQRHLATPQGLLFLVFASCAFVLAFFVRAIRWKLFLNPVRNVRVINVFQLFLIGVFLNFVLPIRAGELAKSLVLKRIAHVPLNQSLPTIAMDKVMDVLPALFLVVLIPFLGVQLDHVFWYILGLANAGLLSLILFVVLAGWKRSVALRLLHLMTELFPGFLKHKVEAFVIGFVETLLLCATRPKTLLLAVLLTGIAVVCDGFYNYFAFWAVGHPISISEALFGYMLYNLFYILPNPPGQVGSNEVVGLLIFGGLLHVPAESVTAMIVLFHAWSGLLMCVMGMGCLSALGVTLSSAIRVQTEGEKAIAESETRNGTD